MAVTSTRSRKYRKESHGGDKVWQKRHDDLLPSDREGDDCYRRDCAKCSENGCRYSLSYRPGVKP